MKENIETKTRRTNKVLNYIRGIIVIFLFFACQYIVPFLLNLFNVDISKLNDLVKIILSFSGEILLFIILIIIYFKDLKENFIDFRKHSMKYLNSGFKYWFIGLMVMMISNIIINVFVTKDIANNEQAVQNYISAAPWFALISVGFIGPIVEELCFRKTFKDAISNKWIFILASGLFFGALHVVTSYTSWTDLLYIVPYSSLGVAFGFMYYETDNICTSMTMHIFHNTILTLMAILGNIL